MAIPLIAAAGARLLPLITRLGSTLGPHISRFMPQVQNLLGMAKTNFPEVAKMAGNVGNFVKGNPMAAEVGKMMIPGYPVTTMGADYLAKSGALGSIKDAWLKGAAGGIA